METTFMIIGEQTYVINVRYHKGKGFILYISPCTLTCSNEFVCYDIDPFSDENKKFFLEPSNRNSKKKIESLTNEVIQDWRDYSKLYLDSLK